MQGKCILVGLPIGNLGDLTVRSREALENGKIFLAEDTRNLLKILSLLGISSEGKKLISFHEHSEKEVLDKVAGWWRNGQDVYYVSDAGSPYISDPGYGLVQKAIENDVIVDTLPGATSVITALELSGLPPQPFHFHGFFPRDNEKKRKVVELCGGNPGTHIFFESPFRVVESVSLFCQSYPNHDFAVVRELTKKFQSVYRFKGSEWDQSVEEMKNKGEFVFLVHIPHSGENSSQLSLDLVAEAEMILKKGSRPKLVAKLLAKILGKETKEIYDQLNRPS